eukprot:692834-Pleurochrysis_carterae.AAC.1
MRPPSPYIRSKSGNTFPMRRQDCACSLPHVHSLRTPSSGATTQIECPGFDHLILDSTRSCSMPVSSGKDRSAS